MRRIISYLLSVLLIIGCVPIMSISAVGLPKYVVNDATVQVDDIFTVDVSIADNPGIISLRFKVVYDSSVIELQGVSDTGLLKGFTNPSPTISSPYTLRWADTLATVDNSNQGAVVKLTFKALSTGQTNVTIEHGESRNSSGKKEGFDNAVAEITIEEKPIVIVCPHTNKTQFAEKASTCTEQGWDAYSKCDTCDQLFNAEGGEIDAIPYRALLAHTNGAPVKENEIAASCEAAGSYDEVVYCTVCHMEISRNKKTIQPLEHDWDEGTVTTPATCTSDGVRTYTCKHDASHTYTEVIPATGHTPAEAVRENEKAETCTKDSSYDEVVYCSVCHAEISRKTITIPAHGHEWDEGTVTTPATCVADGIRTYTCKHDASHTYTEVIPSTGHTPAEAVRENEVAATCSTAGSYDEVVYCSVCHDEVSRKQKTIPIDEDAHDWGEWVQTKAPTETEPGEETRTCKHDPSHTETREIPALGPSQVELSFLDDEVIIVVPNGTTPDGSEFDVQKIVPPPAEVVEKVKEQMGSSSEVLAYYEVRLTADDGSSMFKVG